MVIYVYLVDEAVDCWRPIDAVHEGEDTYRIVSVNSNAEDEHSEFSKDSEIWLGVWDDFRNWLIGAE